MLKFTVINFGIYLLKDHFNSCNNLLKTSRKTIRNCHITEPKNSVRFVVSHWPINSLNDFKFYTWQSYNYRNYKIKKESCIFINDKDSSICKFHTNKYLYCFKLIFKIELGKNSKIKVLFFGYI